MDAAASLDAFGRSLDCLLSQSSVGCSAPSGGILSLITLVMGTLVSGYVSLFKKAIERDFENGVLAGTVFVILVIEFAWFQITLGTAFALGLFIVCLLARGPLSRLKVSSLFGGTITAYSVALICVVALPLHFCGSGTTLLPLESATPKKIGGDFVAASARTPV